MPTALRKLYDQEARAYASNAGVGLLFHWERGQTADAARRISVPKTKTNAAWGAQSVGLLAAALGISIDTIYRQIIFFTVYSDRARVEDLLARAEAAGALLTWTHMRHICHVPECREGAPDPDAYRKSMVDLVISEGLSVRELELEVSTRFPGQKAERPETETRPTRAAGMIRSMAEKALARLDKLCGAGGRLPALEAVDPGDMPAPERKKLKVQLTSDRATILDVSSQWADVAERLSRIIENLDGQPTGRRAVAARR